ncbi:hypothetical protein PMZ80_002023 [Knufia obscura]|uniref:Uncharacterized protein n=1 Tax=Knufia obscura TaxID=1635080 RepID=A0ABR0RW44_9EURO|nr:hypothetical protein PMZ80_002023 [Knufia obscura]
MTSSTNPISVSSESTPAPRERIHAFQDPNTRILYVLPRDTDLGQQYAQLTSKAQQAAFMAEHGRNTGTLPVPGPGHSRKGEGISDEAKAHIADYKKKGYIAYRNEQGDWVVSREEADCNRRKAHEAWRRGGDVGLLEYERMSRDRA